VSKVALRKGKEPPAEDNLGWCARRTEEHDSRNARCVRNLSIVLAAQIRPYLKGGGDIVGATFVGTPQTRQGRVAELPVISIVDDDASVREATARLLRSLGFSAHAFASAKEFLLSPRLSDTSCLIADVEMPGMSGVELQEHLLANGHSTPMIFITAFPDGRVRERALRSGALCFLSKPFDEARLLECVERALARRQNPDGPGAGA
jgi:CheY-like chemotaxis protein